MSFFNIIGGGTVSTTGGGNAQDIQGSILDLQGDVELHSGRSGWSDHCENIQQFVRRSVLADSRA